MAQEQEPLNLALDLVKFVLNYRLLSQILKTVINIYLVHMLFLTLVISPVNVHRQLTVGKEYKRNQDHRDGTTAITLYTLCSMVPVFPYYCFKQHFP